MNSPVLVEPQPVPDVEKKIRVIDDRLQELRTRRETAEKELARLNKEENRLIREFADATGREKADIRGRIDLIAIDRTNAEREMAGLSAVIVEAEEERTKLLPEFEAAWEAKTRRDRAKKLEELRRDHDKNLEACRAADQALLRAREAADRSFFAWTTFKDQETEQERQRALNIAKQGWQSFAGPNARR